jgi:hypothetical protein
VKPRGAIRARARHRRSLLLLQAHAVRRAAQAECYKRSNLPWHPAGERHTSSKCVSLVHFALRRFQWNASHHNMAHTEPIANAVCWVSHIRHVGLTELKSRKKRVRSSRIASARGTC